jgi:hypothetical protein
VIPNTATPSEQGEGEEVRYSDAELLNLDISWFAVDAAGHLGCFASNGTILVPNGVKSSVESYESLAEGLMTSLDVTGSSRYIESSETVHTWLKTAAPTEKSRYISAFSDWSDRGIYSYDCLRRNPEGYFLVSEPCKPLTIDLIPKSFRPLVEQVAFAFFFADTPTVPKEAIP